MTRDEKAAHDKAWNTRHANLVARGDAWVKKNAKAVEAHMMAGAPGSAGWHVRPREDAREGHVVKYGPFKTEEQAKHVGSIIDNVCVGSVYPEYYEDHEARYFLESPEEMGYKSAKILHPSKAPFHEGFKAYGGGWHSALVAVAKHERMGPWAEEGTKMNDLDMANGIIARFSDVLEPQDIAEIAAAGLGNGLRSLVADFVVELYSERGIRDEIAAHEKAWATRKRTVQERSKALFDVVHSAREGKLNLHDLAKDQAKRGVKGQCYPTAYRHAVTGDAGTLVHGDVHLPDGRQMLHAWVERNDGTVHEPEHGVNWSKEEFEKAYRPTVHAKFNPLEARIAMVRQGHMGPWPSGAGTPKKQPPKYSIVAPRKVDSYRDEGAAMHFADTHDRIAQLRGAFEESLALYRDEKAAHAKAWAKRKRAAPAKTTKKPAPKSKVIPAEPAAAIKPKTTNWAKKANAESHAAYLKNTGQAHHTAVVVSDTDPNKFVVHARHWDGSTWGPVIVHESETHKYPKTTDWHSKAEVNRALDPYTAKHLDAWITRVASPEDHEKMRKQITDYIVKDPGVLIDKAKSYPGAQQLRTWREIYMLAKNASPVKFCGAQRRVEILRAFENPE